MNFNGMKHEAADPQARDFGIHGHVPLTFTTGAKSCLNYAVGLILAKKKSWSSQYDGETAQVAAVVTPDSPRDDAESCSTDLY